MFDSDYMMDLIVLGAVALGSAVVAWCCVWIVTMVLVKRFGDRDRDPDIDLRFGRIRRPFTLVASALACYFCLPTLDAIDEQSIDLIGQAMSIVAIVGIGWLVLRVTDVIGQLVSHEWDISKEDNLKERAMLTKFRVMRRVWIGIIVLCTLGAVLMTFPEIRSLGAGLLASAGVAGIVLGIALRPTLETFIASVQVAVTEPINIDDVVIVEGEWGRIEEIRPTYAVVRIWDDRRLVVPLTDFINKPFQNWTRSKSQITGVVTFKVDFATPIDAVREQVKTFVEEDENYDGRFWNVQITDADDRAMTLRVLCTAGNASKAWDLRCAVREKLIVWLRENHPDALPRLRANLERDATRQEKGNEDSA
jgi:small-conductance mechanosensitive channel